MRFKKVLVMGAALVATAFSPAQAQGVFDMGTLTNTLSMDGVTQSEKKRGLKQKTKSKSSAGPSTRMIFPQSAALRQKHLNQFYVVLQQSDPANAAEIKSLFGSANVYRQTDKWMNRYGLKSNSLADCLAVYLSNSWLISRGSNADPSKPQIIGVRNQMARALGSSRAFQKVSNSERQALADNLILQSVLFSVYLEAGKKQPSLKIQAKKIATLSVKDSFGIDINKLKLTNRGLQS